MQMQMQIQLNTNYQSAPQFKAITNHRPFLDGNSRQNFNNTQTRNSNGNSRNCGLRWSTNHRDKCLVGVKITLNVDYGDIAILQKTHSSEICVETTQWNNKTVKAIPVDNYKSECDFNYNSSD